MTGEEQWEPIPGYDDYEASSLGRIQNVGRGHVLRGTVTRRGYRQYSLRGRRGRRAAYGHRLVLAAFVGPPPPGHFAEHRNGDRLDDRVANLTYTPPCATARGLPGERNPNARLTAEQVRQMRALRQEGVSVAVLGEMFGVTARAAHLVVTRRAWRHVA